MVIKKSYLKVGATILFNMFIGAVCAYIALDWLVQMLVDVVNFIKDDDFSVSFWHYWMLAAYGYGIAFALQDKPVTFETVKNLGNWRLFTMPLSLAFIAFGFIMSWL